MARAIPARFAMPPEISAGIIDAASARPTRPSLTLATAARASGGRFVNISSGSMTFSSKVMEPNSAPDWNITPMPAAPDPVRPDHLLLQSYAPQ